MKIVYFNILLFITTFIFFHNKTIKSLKIDNLIETNMVQSLNCNIDNFNFFFKKFNFNPDYQINHIIFPLKIITFDETNSKTTFLKKNKWENIKLINNGCSEVKIVCISKTMVKIEYTERDTGIHIYHYFEKYKDNWKLKYIENRTD